MSQNIANRITLKTASGYDFITSLIRFANHKRFNEQSSTYNLKPNLEITTWVENNQAKLDSTTQDTINFYFSHKTRFGYGLCAWLQDKKLKSSIPEFISALEETKTNQLICYLLKPIYSGKQQLTTKKINHLTNYDTEIYDIIEENFTGAETDNWKIMRLLSKPGAVKQELIDLLTNYYQQIYSSIEEQAKKIVTEKLETSSSQLKTACSKGITKLYSLEENLINHDQPITTVITYFADFADIGYYFPNLFIVGYRFPDYIDKVVTDKQDLTNQAHVFKTLGDKTRLKLLLALEQGPKYATELAEILDISTSTINYHINKFLNAGLIKIDKRENKVYYSLKKPRLTQLISQLQTDFNLPDTN